MHAEGQRFESVILHKIKSSTLTYWKKQIEKILSKISKVKKTEKTRVKKLKEFKT